MKLTFENLGTNTYLVYEIKETDELDSMSLGMLTNNSIPGFAPVSFTQMDMTKYIKYNVSAKVSVKQLFSGPVNKKRLIGVFTGVVDAMLSAEDYMLDPSSIMLDMDYIFADVSTCETELVCLPIMNLQHENQDLTMFFKNILFTTQFDQTENCDHVAQLINYLNTNSVLVLSDFKALLNGISNTAAAQPKVETKPVQQPGMRLMQSPVVRPVSQPISQPVVTPTQVAVPNNAPLQQKVVAKKEPPAVLAVPPAAKPQTKVPQTADTGKPMSFFYLMQHYNKENAAIYKAQQEAAKAKKATPAPAKTTPNKPADKRPCPGIAVPGQEIPSVSIPGQATPQPVTPAQPVKAQPVAPLQTVSQPAAAILLSPQPVYHAQSETPLNFGETTVLGGTIGETTVLGVTAESSRRDPHLIRTKNNERIPLNKPVFRIGKERSYVDYFVSDNTAVSRSHANIINRNGVFFVVDTNSTNHTYVNGGMIQSNVETKLAHGTKIRLANEEFEFRLY